MVEGVSPTVFGFVYSHGAVLKPEEFFAYRKRRPERPPAGKIACHTKFGDSSRRGRDGRLSESGAQGPSFATPAESR
jgi:hypothetical protein